MTWAEPFALGELGLMPEQFWRLTVREFWVKFAAFQRAEDRARSLMLEHVSLTSTRKSKTAQHQLERAVNALRRYPVKPWLRRDD